MEKLSDIVEAFCYGFYIHARSSIYFTPDVKRLRPKGRGIKPSFD